MIAHHSNLWYYTQRPTGYSPMIMIKVVATPHLIVEGVKLIIGGGNMDEMKDFNGKGSGPGSGENIEGFIKIGG